MSVDNAVWRFGRFQDEIREELLTMQKFQSVTKDILIVVHNQVDLLERCLWSIVENTMAYHLFIWDNNSEPALRERVWKICLSGTFDYLWSRTNEGFIVPNNIMASVGSSPYIILLNSDTEVKKGWDEAMIAWMQTHPEVGQVGYLGGMLDEEFRGVRGELGSDIHYLNGWCFCIARTLYESFGLFDADNLEFAYGEDSDFSFRLREAGKEIYALHLGLVDHVGSATALKLMEEGLDLHAIADRNHQYLRRRHKCPISPKSKSSKPMGSSSADGLE